MNQPSMRALILKAKQEKQQKLDQQKLAQLQPVNPNNEHPQPSQSPNPNQPLSKTSTAVSLPFISNPDQSQWDEDQFNHIETTHLPMRSPITKLPTPTLPQSFVTRINRVSINEVDTYLAANMPELYEITKGSMCGDYQVKLFDEPDYFYCQNFLSPLEELCVLTLINSTPSHQWAKLSRRHLCMFGGKVLPEGLEPEEIPRWLEDLFDKIEAFNILFYSRSQAELLTLSSSTTPPPNESASPVRPNHVLLNYYSVNDQIMPHKDGPAYFPQAVIISLLSSLTLSYWSTLQDAHESGIVGAKFNFYLEPRSLFIMRNGCYNDLFHGIDGVTYDPILNTHVNRGGINYQHQFIPLQDFIQHLDDLETIRGSGDVEVQRYHKMLERIQIEKDEGDDKMTISQRCERLSLTIRRVDPILSPSDKRK